MKSIKALVKRNAPVFILGFAILIVFMAIIFTDPSDTVPRPGFIQVPEDIFEDREPAEPTPEPSPIVYAPQTVSPENKGKPYFYGEYNPNLRDDEGYPAPPALGSTPISQNYTKEDRDILKGLEQEKLNERLNPTRIAFSDNGFSPADTSAYTGREITWTNNTSGEIKIVEAVPRHEALKNGVTIRPGESFTFRPLVAFMLTYMEVNTKRYGTVMVNDVTTPLLDGYSPGM